MNPSKSSALLNSPVANIISRALAVLLRSISNSSLPTPETPASSVSFDRDKFHAVLDVQYFEPTDISVEVMDNTVTVEGKQEDKASDERYISRHFVKKYVLPKGYYDMKKVASELSADGVLTVSAPKYNCRCEDCARKVQIVLTGQSVKR